MPTAPTRALALAPVLLALAGALALGQLVPRHAPDRDDGPCAVPAPVVALAAASKRDPADPTGVREGPGAADRLIALRPVRGAVRAIAEGAAGDAGARKCAARALVAWARAGALTDMRTKDANLTRGRLGGELLVAALALDARGALSSADRTRVARARRSP